MPIYAYRCESCGHAQDVLQKMSDPVLTRCPSCGAEAYKKQVTAAGFQLKGTGWYVTDFRGGNAATGKGTAEPTADAKEKSPAPADGAAETSDAKPAKAAGSESSSSSATDTVPPPSSAKPSSDTQ